MANAPLYARILGASWFRVAEPVRVAHATESIVRARGLLRISHGHGRTARFLARVLRLPRASDAADTRLVVTPRAGGEDWHRTFDGRRLDTRQYEAAAGVLAERIGILEFRFQIEASDGSILFRQVEVALVCGPLRIPLPAACAPTIAAREEPAGAQRVRIHVRVVLPAVGPLITYDGTVDFEEARA